MDYTELMYARDVGLAEALGYRWYQNALVDAVQWFAQPQDVADSVDEWRPIDWPADATMMDAAAHTPRFHADRDACAGLLAWLSEQDGRMRGAFMERLGTILYHHAYQNPNAAERQGWLLLLAQPAQIAEAADAALLAAGKERE